MSRQLLEQHYPTVLNAKQALNQSVKLLQTAGAAVEVNVARQQQLTGQTRALQSALNELTQKFEKFKPSASSTELQLWNSRLARVNADAKILIQQARKLIKLGDHKYLLEGKDLLRVGGHVATTLFPETRLDERTRPTARV